VGVTVLFAFFVLLVGSAPGVGALAPLRLPMLQGTGSVSGVVYFDKNGNGVRNPNEPGIAGVALQLADAATGGLNYAATATTDDTGAYEFPGQVADTYWVSATNPGGYTSTTASLVTVTLQIDPVTGVDFGATILKTVVGTVFQDTNGDGFQGLREVPIPGRLIQVIDDVNNNGVGDINEAVLGYANNDDQGNYAIHDVLPGNRVLKVQPQAGGTGPTTQESLPLTSDEAGGASGAIVVNVGEQADGTARVVVGGAGPVLVDEAGNEYVGDELMVHFAPGVAPSAIRAILADHGLALVHIIQGIDVYLVRSAPGQVDAAIAHLLRLPEVAYAERNYVVRGEQIAVNDPVYNDANAVYAPQIINAPAAWAVTTGITDVIVAVVDSGVSFTHPEFTGRLLPGYDFVNNDGDPSDDQGHGTHVTGIIAAAMNNNLGSTGIAPGVRVLPVKVLNASNAGTWAGIANGITYAVNNGAKVINLSLGGSTTALALQNAIQYAYDHRVFVAVAAGNDQTSTAYYPAAYPQTMAVMATDNYDQRWTLSNYGASVDIGAPGFAIYSTYWRSTDPHSFEYLSGTSMATPHVAALAALLLSYRPDLAIEDLRAIMQSTAVDLGALGRDDYYGWGRINAGTALAAAANWVPYPATPTFTPTNTPTNTPTRTPTKTPIPTWTPTPTNTNTPTPTDTPVAPPTDTPTPTPTWTDTPVPTPTPTATFTPTPTNTPPPYLQRVNSGGTTFTDSQSRVWAADKAFATGSWGYTAGTAKGFSTAVNNTIDDALYQKTRIAPGEYRLTVPNGNYVVALKFTEFEVSSATDRVFNITIEGVVVESGLSIWSVAGRYAALDRAYRVTVGDGLLNVAFTRVGGRKDPVVSAIEVKSDVPPTPTPTPTPTITPGGPTLTPTPTPTLTSTPTPTNTPPPYDQRVNSGGTTYTDTTGQAWAADKAFATGSWGYATGSAKSSTKAVANTNDDLLYQKYREIAGEYKFTVPNGTYEVTLKFAEFAYTSGRAMNISMEGVLVENSLNVYGVVGLYAALDRTYTVTVNDGILNILFAKAPSNSRTPAISAIRVRSAP
jgi:thermitase